MYYINTFTRKKDNGSFLIINKDELSIGETKFTYKERALQTNRQKGAQIKDRSIRSDSVDGNKDKQRKIFTYGETN